MLIKPKRKGKEGGKRNSRGQEKKETRDENKTSHAFMVSSEDFYYAVQEEEFHRATVGGRKKGSKENHI